MMQVDRVQPRERAISTHAASCTGGATSTGRRERADGATGLIQLGKNWLPSQRRPSFCTLASPATSRQLLAANATVAASLSISVRAGCTAAGLAGPSVSGR